LSSRQGRSFGPSRGKMGARSHTVVDDDHRSKNQHATGARRGSTARPLIASEPVRSRPVRERSLKGAHAQSDSTENRPRLREREHAQSKRTPTQKRSNRPCSFPLYPAYANIRIQRPGGGSHARPLVGRKGGVYFSGSGHLHTRVSHFSFHQKSWMAIPPLLSAWCCSRRKKRKSRRWSAGGERWRRDDVGEGVRWRRCCDAGEGVMWRRCCDVAGVVEWWWSGG